MIRTRADLYGWSASNEHGRQMHQAVAILDRALATGDPAAVFVVTQKAIASAMRVIARADDSSGIIGDACGRLLDLHPRAALAAKAPTAALVDWMVAFQFAGEVDYFTLDPVAYAPALGELGLARYRRALDAVAAGLDPEPSEDQPWTAPDSHTRFVLEWNARRLAVLDCDVDEIIRTHARDKQVAAWFEDTARAFEEVGEFDLAIDWAQQAVHFDGGHQSRKAGDYWCALLAEHRPAEHLDGLVEVFRRWPSSTTASCLHSVAGGQWPAYREEVMQTLSRSPRDAVLFTLLELKDVPQGWQLAHSLGLEDDETWDRLAIQYQGIDPIAVLPVHQRLVEHELREADTYRYRSAARRLALMRRLSAGTSGEASVDGLIAELREKHRRRPRLQKEFDLAGLH